MCYFQIHLFSFVLVTIYNCEHRNNILFENLFITSVCIVANDNKKISKQSGRNFHLF